MSKEVIEVEAEEIKTESTFPVAVDKALNNELARLDKFKIRIAELKEKYSGLEIKDENDRDGYEAMIEGIAEIRGIRVGTDKDRRNIKAPLIAAGKSIEEKAQWIISELEAIENPLIERKKWYDLQKETKRLNKQLADAERLKGRMAILLGFGVVTDGVNVILENAEYELNEIREVDEDVFQEVMVPKYKAVFDANEIVRLAKKKADDEAEELRQQQLRDFEKQQQKLKEDQDKVDKENKRIEAEKQKAIAIRTKARADYLEELGMVYNFQEEGFQAPYRRVIIPHPSLITLTEEEWAYFMLETKPIIADAKKQMDEEILAEKQKRNDEAVAKYEEDRKRMDAERIRKELEEAAEGNDQDRWRFFVKKLSAIEFPIMESRQYKRLLESAKEAIEIIKASKATRNM